MTEGEKEIIYSTSFPLIESRDFADCVIHILCLCGEARFVYDGRTFFIRSNDVAIITQPQLISDCCQTADLQVEIIAAKSDFLHRQWPANNFGIGGTISLFDNPVIHLSDNDRLILQTDMQAIRNRIEDTGHPLYRELTGRLALTMMYDLFAFPKADRDSMYATDRSLYVVKELMEMLQAGLPKYYRVVKYYAGRLNVTPQYLSDTVRRQTGHNVTYFIGRHTLPMHR